MITQFGQIRKVLVNAANTMFDNNADGINSFKMCTDS